MSVSKGNCVISLRENCRGTRIWISNARTLLQPPTTTPIISNVVVNYAVLFTMLWPLFVMREE